MRRKRQNHKQLKGGCRNKIGHHTSTYLATKMNQKQCYIWNLTTINTTTKATFLILVLLNNE